MESIDSRPNQGDSGKAYPHGKPTREQTVKWMLNPDDPEGIAYRNEQRAQQRERERLELEEKARLDACPERAARRAERKAFVESAMRPYRDQNGAVKLPPLPGVAPAPEHVPSPVPQAVQAPPPAPPAPRALPPLPKAVLPPQLFPSYDASTPLAMPLPPVVPEGVRLRPWEVPLSGMDLKSAAVAFPFHRLPDVARAAWKSLDAGLIELPEMLEIERLIELNRAIEPRPQGPRIPRQRRRCILRSIHKRKKEFGDGSPQPLTSQEKKRIMNHARELRRKTEKGMHYGKLTAKNCDVLQALLYGFHNSETGLCFPSYASIAEKAGCCRETVRTSLIALEAVGILSWVHRLARVRIGGRVRVIRTSNGYRFRVPGERAAGGAATTEKNFKFYIN
jgi:hypothetical protein